MVINIIDFLITLCEVGYKKISKKKFPFIKEHYGYECGPRCLQMMFKYYGKEVDFDTIAQETDLTEKGANLLSLSNCAKNHGFKSLGVKVTFDGIDGKQNGLVDVPLPCIAHWDGNYFVILTKVTWDKITMIHPRKGKLIFNRHEFCDRWISRTEDDDTGIALLIEKFK
ncbi:cysteine peptidase family C39 domain-containing protein [Dokdonia sp.]|uniref:cysteine peptidase family C39 domain-containing protein n=1 Tax=Dokdonia sp. TaxID=2024995 RepID=UPI003265D09E